MINRRVAVLPALGIKETRFGLALGELVAATVKRAYDDEVPPVPTAERAALDGFRPNGIRAEPAYKARPLDGIWATPPFLHNGSVPTLYHLLVPNERPAIFVKSRLDYDKKLAGFAWNANDTTANKEGYVFDTRLSPAMSNKGHDKDIQQDGKTFKLNWSNDKAEALAIIEDLKPKRAFLTHLNHDILHERDSLLLPDNVKLAYDELVVGEN